MSEHRGKNLRGSASSGGLVNSVVHRWQSFLARFEQTRDALAEVEAQRDDMIAYLSTVRVVMDVLERTRTFDQACQEVTETLVAELGAETCVLAIRSRPDEPFVLRGFHGQSLRWGRGAVRPSITESTWLTTAALVSVHREPVFYRHLADGSLVAEPQLGGHPGLLGLPLRIGGEGNGAIVLEYTVAAAHEFARGPALALVAETISGALTTARTRDQTATVLTSLRREVGATKGELTERDASLRQKEDSLAELTRALIQSNRARREFLGTLSHELRTPLNAVLGYSELLRDGLVGPVTAEQATMLDRILVSTRNLNQLIDDMLFFVQLDGDPPKAKPETFRLTDLVEEVVGSLPSRRHHSETELKVDLDERVETLRCDRKLMRRILFHLLGNGFKFTERGEVRLMATDWESGAGVRIVVKDTGVGMSEARTEEVFEAFRQLDMSSTRRHEGVGLGLAVVKGCVQLLGGDISVSSRLGKGSEFTVHLPTTDPTLEAETRAGDEASSSP